MGRLQKIINQYNKELEGSIIKLSDVPYKGVQRASTGSFSMDIATGGGLPCSSIIELFGKPSTGKSLLCLKAIARMQKKFDKDCVYIDLEGALTEEWAVKVGVDPEKLWIVRPKTAEKGLDMLVDFVSSREVGIVVVDSVAALCPIVEIEESLSKQQMGLAAKLMSKTMRVLASTLQPENLGNKENYNPSIVIFINQIRMKIGVLWGCVHGETLVYTDKGGIPIADIVRKRLKVKVFSYNTKKNKYEFKKIEKYYNNGKIKNKKDYIHIQTESINSRGGRFGFTITQNHRVLTKKGWKEAKNIKVNDYIQSSYINNINGTLRNFLYGTVMGDSKLYIRSHNTACLRLVDNKNKAYENWKMDKLKKYFKFVKIGKGIRTNYNYELAKLKKEIGNRNPNIFLKQHFSKLGLALWIMDDGHFDGTTSHCRYSISIKRFKHNKKILDEISKSLDFLGYPNKYNINDGNFRFNKQISLKIAKDICKYIPPPMQYKLPLLFKNKYKEFKLTNTPAIKKDFVKVLEKRYASLRQLRKKDKYDLKIKDNCNYVVGGKHNGIIIHNSPEVTPGGEALKFYSDVRIKLKRGETIKEAKAIIGQNIKFQIVKNKTYKPMQVGELSFYYDGHIDNEESIVNYAIVFELIEQRGAWFYFKEEKFQGKEKLISYLKEKPKILLRLKKDIIDILKKD